MAERHIVAIGGSDAGISAALRARELDPTAQFTVVVADAYPNFSICGIPYYVSGEVTRWTNLAHRTAADLAATGNAGPDRHPGHPNQRQRAHPRHPRPRTASRNNCPTTPSSWVPAPSAPGHQSSA